ncbi:class I SAM-dependent methyltransferase [Anaerocolumna xylanovorans]|uniref:Leucine carboxyl methyltransferase n=1 Tax=Anaerocolumna xylanovorans DSM 12503 TaxID=1121345 RepID=A0A1M7XWR6_9FIRM|nr:class I SAM-dependent methyltransferase [Anaerocolumna xylanovorans]SHO43258.1 Leucine carboxyl methyltransferase [Anaerocolumna xylanovorans DSM 12503]
MNLSEVKTTTGDIKVNLKNVHETLLLPLWCRAMVSEFHCPDLEDLYANDIIKQLDYDFSGFHSHIKNYFIILLAARAKEMEQQVKRYISLHPGATIVNIGAGLDTTFYRINNGTVKWYDLDAPGVVYLRKTLLKDDPRKTSIAKSMFDPSFPDEIIPSGDGLLFLISGVLMYFTEEEVRSLFRLLASRFPGCEVLFDHLTPFGLATADHMVKRSGIHGAKMQWGSNNICSLEKWGIQISLLESHPVCNDFTLNPSSGILSNLLIRLNRLLRIYTLNQIRIS